MSEFLNMGGYAFFVWTSYALVTVVLVLNYIIPRSRLKRQLRELGALVRRDQSRQQTRRSNKHSSH